MELSHVTDDVGAPANDDDNDVNNPFNEPVSTCSSSMSDLRAKFHPGTVSASDT